MLEGVVTRGTATNLKNDNYRIAGKTGTAQTDYGRAGIDHEYQASFVGYFPADKPRYSIIVVINQPDKTTGYYANAVAGPVFKEIADRLHASDMEYNMKLDFKYDTVIPYAKTGYKSEINKVYRWMGFNTDQEFIAKDQVAKPYIESRSVKYYPRNYSNRGSIPDVLGMGLRDAIQILEDFGLKVNIQGRGKVIRQEPEPLQPFRKGQTITLILG